MGPLIVASAIVLVVFAIMVWAFLWVASDPPQQNHSESVRAWYREDGTRKDRP